MKVIGLTGSIGMGKSTTANMFSKLGVPVHDSDQEARDVLALGGAAVKAVLQEFPQCAYKTDSSQIDRAALRQIVFDDALARKRLEDIIHPFVWKAQKDFIKAARNNGLDCVVLDIPLLFETGANLRVDFTLVVSAPFHEQKRRVLARPNMSEEIFNKVLATQMADKEKRRRADFVINTGLNIADTMDQVKTTLKHIRNTPKP
jgi:dephospho-CoA kinase